MTRRELRVWQRVWELLTEPRSVTLITLTGYLACIAVGVHALVTPSVTGVRDLMAVLLILGGILAAAGCPFGQWWIERIGLIGLAFGFAMRTLLVVSYSRPDASFALLTLHMVGVLLATRWIRIRYLPIDPRRPLSLWELRRGCR